MVRYHAAGMTLPEKFNRLNRSTVAFPVPNIGSIPFSPFFFHLIFPQLSAIPAQIFFYLFRTDCLYAYPSPKQLP